MDRRDFIKTSCSFCIALGAGLLAGSLSSCAQYLVYETEEVGEKIVVPAAIFAKNNFQIIHAKSLKFNIALIKEKNESYTALLLRCTHASTPLTYTGSDFECPLHGSAFDLDGRVTEGPAIRPLTKFKTLISGSSIIIDLG
jgi:Rieske Fe-S protein